MHALTDSLVRRGATPPAATRSRLAELVGTAVREVRRRPATIALTLAVVLASAAAGAARGWLADSDPFDVRAILLRLFVVDAPAEALAVIAAVAVVCWFAETAMGGGRTLLAYLGGGVIISVVGLLIGRGVDALTTALPLTSSPQTGTPPIPAVLCVAVTASCFAGPLWRRRVRLAALLVAVTLFLYSASATELFALVALPVGLALGLLAGASAPSLRVHRSSRHETRVLLASAVAITAVGPVVATVWGQDAGLLSVYGWLSYDPLTVAGGRVCAVGSATAGCPTVLGDYAQLQPAAGWIAVLPVVVLLLCAAGILRGSRLAALVALVMNAGVFVGMLVVLTITETDTIDALSAVRDVAEAGYTWRVLVGTAVGAVVPLLIAVLLVTQRRAVQVRTEPRRRVRFLVGIALSAAAAIVPAAIGMVILRGEYSPEPDVAAVLATLPLRLVPPSLIPAEAIGFVPETALAQVFWYLPAVVFWCGVGVCVLTLLPAAAAPGQGADRARATAVLHRGGGDSLAFMALWPGNQVWFSPSVDAAIAYRVEHGVAVTVGGALGADRGDPRVSRDFIDFCARHGWTPLFYSVDEAARQSLADLGWQHTQVAEEALLDPVTWAPSGKRRQDVRTATNRAAREGVQAVWTRWRDLSLTQRTQVQSISDAWVGEKDIPEMGFTLGGMEELADDEVRLMIAVDAQQQIVAVTSWMPLHGDDGPAGYVLDFLRRRSDAMPGVMEFLIGSAVAAIRAEGLTVVSLSGSPLSFHRPPGQARTPVEAFLETTGALLEPAYGFRSLSSFKAKFQDRTSPLWMLYADPAQLPAIGRAVMACYLPGMTLGGAARIAAGLRRRRRPDRGRPGRPVPSRAQRA